MSTKDELYREAGQYFLEQMADRLIFSGRFSREAERQTQKFQMELAMLNAQESIASTAMLKPIPKEPLAP